ncbi:PP2C family serine/threonine-protein phosphatase [Gemmatimonas groenlandica]|uniref:Protein phosphatase 2C domain-containing protein n=1 Tax=Gemmatimonas groenlandica TaxID=2732249 RepID=A0A6M4ILL7_9BACT|nr:PP2C family serine/threonine-protein phosphatase [Gemmatimonas groenlandica]QJR35603.1 protein phosphatase 2C domain-containing protein [Gemmatimonas groenlandica]
MPDETSESETRDTLLPEVPVAAPVAAEPARAIWTVTPPISPWCPAEWSAHLDAVAPGLVRPDAHGPLAEATGMRAARDGWSLLVASRRGRLHAHRGDHREDAGQLLLFDHGWCAAVADGAGSATYSRLGAAIATHVATHTVRETLHHGHADTTQPSLLGRALEAGATAANHALRDFAAKCGLALRDLRTTLLVAAHHGGRIGLLQVGDGASAWLNADGTVSQPLSGAITEFSGEVAHFLPDDGAIEHLVQSLVIRDAAHCAALILATDGVEDPWYPFTRHAGPLYAQLLHGVNDAVSAGGVTSSHPAPVLSASDPVHALIEWLAFEKRGENDDRTLCVIRQDGVAWAP